MQAHLRTDVRMISERLKKVREELGLTQQGLADRLGVSLRAQQNYEAGKRAPDADYLAAIAAAGADVLFILTGQRSQQIPAAATLSPRQRALLDNFDNTSEEGKKIIEGTADMAAKSTSPKRNAKRESEQLPTIGKVKGQVIQGNQTNKGPQVFNFGPGSVTTGSRKPSD